jgi:hypothetical protein
VSDSPRRFPFDGPDTIVRITIDSAVIDHDNEAISCGNSAVGYVFSDANMRHMMMKLLLTAIAIVAVSFSPVALVAKDANDVTSLNERIELLESQLKAVTLERDALRKELKQLKESKDQEDKAKDATPLGSVWKGKCTAQHLGKTDISGLECSVIARENKNLTLLASLEGGAAFEFDCQYTTRHRFKIVSVRRVQSHLPAGAFVAPTGGITGTGIADEKKLNLQWVWKRADGLMSGKYELTREK